MHRRFGCRSYGPVTGSVRRNLTREELLAVFAALGHPQRLRIIAKLAEGRIHVSELARQLGLSRPLLYMHLASLEKAGMVAGHLELSSDGKAMKYYELEPFDVQLNLETLLAAAHEDRADDDGTVDPRADPDRAVPLGGVGRGTDDEEAWRLEAQGEGATGNHTRSGRRNRRERRNNVDPKETAP